MKAKLHAVASMPPAQNGDKALNNTIHRRWLALWLGGFLFISVFALWPSSAQAGCSQYDVSGQWTITQGSYLIHVVLSQNGKTISGTAQQTWVSDHQVQVLHGQVTGTIAGAEFNVQINWPNGGAGIYRGTIAKSERLFGTTYDKNNLRSTASWETDHHFNCADAAAAPPVVKSSGHMPKPAANPSPDTAAAADNWIDQELRKRKTAKQPTPSADKATPTPSAEVDESSSSDTEDRHGKHKKNKNKKKHHHDGDDQDQGND